MAFNSRVGSNLREVKPHGYTPAVPCMGGEEIGTNTLVGVRSDNGLAEQLDSAAIEAEGSTYKEVLVATEEVDTVGLANGDHVEGSKIKKDLTLVLNGSGFAQSNVYDTVYAVDHDTVDLNSDSVGDGTGTPQPEAGKIVEFIDSTTVRVLVNAA